MAKNGTSSKPASTQAPAPGNATKKLDIIAVAALVCGVISVVSCVTFVGGVVLGIAAILLGVLNWLRTHDKLALAGFIAGAAGVIVSIGLFMAGLSLFGKLVIIPRTGDVPANGVDALEVGQPVVERLPVTCEDGDVCSFRVTRIWYDEGEIIVYYTIVDRDTHSNTVPGQERLYVPDDVEWTINGARVVPSSLYTTVNEGEEYEGWFYFDQESLEGLGITCEEDVLSIHGVIAVDMIVSGSTAATYVFNVDL